VEIGGSHDAIAAASGGEAPTVRFFERRRGCRGGARLRTRGRLFRKRRIKIPQLASTGSLICARKDFLVVTTILPQLFLVLAEVLCYAIIPLHAAYDDRPNFGLPFPPLSYGRQCPFFMYKLVLYRGELYTTLFSFVALVHTL